MLRGDKHCFFIQKLKGALFVVAAALMRLMIFAPIIGIKE
jgi:hypothetical protein